MEVQRLGKENYDEIIGLMNYVFTLKNGKEMDLERELPKMCVRNDVHMRKHFGIFCDGKLVSALGVYPYETIVNGKKMLFATMGNVVTHPDYEGNGYMTKLLDRGEQELRDLNVDVARLGGLRSRYNRYGFECGGQVYKFVFTAKNREKKFFNFSDDITFEEVNPNDKEEMAFVTNLYNKNEIAVTRTPCNAYVTMIAWQNTPYIARKNGKAVGYLVVDKSQTTLAEQFAVDVNSFTDMICAWQKRVNSTIHFTLQPHQIEKIRIFTAVCERFSMDSPSHFCILSWEKVIDAFIKLKHEYCALPKGELVVKIESYGTVRIYVDDFGAGCEKTNATPMLTMDRLMATRYIFGLYPAVTTAEVGHLAQAWFPLPLSWNLQDRV